ncbi:MAG: DNA polymerase III subunit delta [bacterium]
MILLIYGSDSYQINQCLRKIKADYPDDNLSVVELADDASWQTIEQEINSLPFLSNKKLIIVNGLSKTKDTKTQKSLELVLDSVAEGVDLIFIENELKPQNWLFKLIQKKGKSEIKNLLKPYEITSWISKKANEKEAQIDRDASELLSAKIGNDLWRLDNELEKLKTYDQHITKENVTNLVESEFLDSIFALMDAISEKKTEKAIELTQNFSADPNNISYIISMIARQIRNLLTIKELDQGGLKEGEIAKKLQLHPFVIKNTLKQSRNFTFDDLLDFHKALIKTDYLTKTSSAEPKSLIIQMVIKACQN